jgi:transcriptional regulator with XRE-family HTH domain
MARRGCPRGIYNVNSTWMAVGIQKPLGRVLTSLGTRLRALRTEREWTLERLAKLSNFSEPYLSRLESGSRQPSLAALLTLARVFEIPLRTLLEDEDGTMPSCKIIRAGSTTSGIANGMSYRAVSGGGALTGLQAMEMRVPAKRQDDKFYTHDGEEWLYVISGGLSLLFEREKHALQPGDAAHFDARTPHRLAATGKNDAVVLLVASLAHRNV